MKSITPLLSGLASSLFLNVGLTRLAEKLDPMVKHHRQTDYSGPVYASAIPCAFTPRAAR
jgi:hypothetical protein